jgi:uncharacterized membrane-anchored protein YhcB (DUF1043 family)
MFWIGCVGGMFAGASIRLLIAGLCIAAARGDRQLEAELEKKERGLSQ